ncbi:ABC transporter substrate-binding protein [Dactylosporangium sp. McL0621]|uniref:ABC transporter substrate-binding protein n=1 Tax=Dactylosporangium sp. McL0621 TaxID=3415678 RepID=UPI003CE8ADAE
MPSQRKIVLAALTAGVVALTAACGGGDAKDSTPNAGGSDQARYGGTMTVAYQSDPKTFDPAVCYDATCWNNMRMLYDRLYDYVGDTMNIEPQAATALPEVSADGLTYTIKLRSGMTFSDGKSVTAKDVAWSLTRILDPATKSPVQSFWTGVAGAADYAKSPTGTLAGIAAVDDGTVQIKLTAPNSSFKYVLAMPHASIIEQGTASKPVGSGPFVMDHFTPGQEIVVNRNQKYWDAPKPYVDKVVEKLGVDPHVQLLSLQKGSIDLMGDPIPAADYLTVSGDASLKPQIKTIVKPSTYYVTMNTQMAPFDNPKVREAVSYAFDRSFLLKLVAGQGSVANEYLPPGITGYTKDKLVHDQDIAKAKQLLAEAGFPNGFSTTMYSWNTSPWTALLPQLQQDLGKIGITVDAKPVQQSAFFDLAGTPNKAPMTLTFWVADYPDASDFYQALLSCGAAIPGGQNYPFYCNKSVDDLVNQALAAKDNDAATALYVQATKAMLADNPVVPLYYGSKTEVFGKTVGGYHSQPIWGWDMTNYWKTTGTAGR